MFARSRPPFFALLAGLLLATGANAQTLYWLDTNFPAPTLHKADANGATISSVALTPGTLPEGLAFDASGDLFWAEALISGGSINRATSALGDVAVIATGISAGRGVAVDAVAGQVYWTTSNMFIGGTVRRTSTDGTGTAVLISLPSGYAPRGIAVDQTLRKIWWADFLQNAIYYANLDGTDLTLWLPLPAGSAPYGVALDPTNQQIYWTEYGSGSIKRSSTSSPSSTTVLTGLGNPTYLTMDVPGARLYWSESAAGAQCIKRSTTAGTSVTTLPCPITTYGGLAYRPSTSVSVPGSSLPADFGLEPVRPNPGTGLFRARFDLPREARVRLSVFDVQGRELTVLADGLLPAGSHERVWNAGASRAQAQAGVYFLRFITPEHTWNRRFALVR